MSRERDARAATPADTGLAALASRMQVVFPPGTRLLGASTSQGMDEAVYAKVELAASAWPALLASSPVRDEEFSEDQRYLLGADDGWWDPKAPRALPTAQAPLPQTKFLNVGVDRSRGDTVVVYLMWHET